MPVGPSLLQQALPPIPATAVRDTVSRLLEQRAYDRGLRDTLWARAIAWIGDTLGDLFDLAARAPFGRAVALAVVMFVVAAIIGRALLVARARRRARELRPAPVTARELLAQARALARQGVFTDAAHLLHAAIVAQLAADGRVRPHPSSTVGDYARALRRGDATTWRAYREFGRRYEVIVYGDGRCDAERWAALDALAAPLVDDARPADARERPVRSAA
ncbi:MAG: DUF4129 domain-containing protein [Gemmatimonadaceae bacterium]|nr:DUF4129 domain-containing protein [Gemmatimonadaceae bacterium]